VVEAAGLLVVKLAFYFLVFLHPLLHHVRLFLVLALVEVEVVLLLQ